MAELKMDGFTRLKPVAREGIVISLTGKEKHGKSHFALTAPGPIAYFDFDRRLKHLLPKFPDKVILHREVAFPYPSKIAGATGPVEMNQKKYIDLWNDFLAKWETAANNSEVKTTVVDTGTALWELLRLAYFGKLSQVKAIHYGDANNAMEELVADYRKSGKNLILIHRFTDEFADDKPTGRLKRKGYNAIGYCVDTNLEIEWDNTVQEDGSIVGPRLRVIDFGDDMTWSGSEFTGDMVNFDTVAGLRK